MAISGVGQSYYQNNVATTKSTKSVNSTGETGNTKELSEAEEMAIFKKEFYAEIDKIPRNRTITNVAINISEEAFKNMKDDPEYREKTVSYTHLDVYKRQEFAQCTPSYQQTLSGWISPNCAKRVCWRKGY